MSGVSIGENHRLRVGSALLSIVSGFIIIGVSKECGADAVGGIFLGAGGLGLLISTYPFIRTWLSVHQILPNMGNFRIHPMEPAPGVLAEPPADGLRREGTQVQMESSKNRMDTFVDTGATPAQPLQEDRSAADIPDILGRS